MLLLINLLINMNIKFHLYLLIYNKLQMSTQQKILIYFNLSWCSSTYIICFTNTYIRRYIPLMIKNIPSSFEYRFRRDLE